MNRGFAAKDLIMNSYALYVHHQRPPSSREAARQYALLAAVREVERSRRRSRRRAKPVRALRRAAARALRSTAGLVDAR